MATLRTEAEVFGPFGHYVRPATLIVQTNGGSVTLAVLAEGDKDDPGATWIDQEVYTDVSKPAHKIEVNNTTVRLTPTPGAKYSLTGV